jgi:hypothetical protein
MGSSKDARPASPYSSHFAYWNVAAPLGGLLDWIRAVTSPQQRERVNWLASYASPPWLKIALAEPELVAKAQSVQHLVETNLDALPSAAVPAAITIRAILAELFQDPDCILWRVCIGATLVARLEEAVATFISAAPAGSDGPSLGESQNSAAQAEALRDSKAPKSAKDIAARVRQLGGTGSDDAIASKLTRLRDKYPDCYIESESPRRGEPKYLYRPEVVRMLLSEATIDTDDRRSSDDD